MSRRLSDTCRKRGISVRPHAKSHKSAEIARRQIAAGALGVCCAKPGELLALFEGGYHLAIAVAPVASSAKIEALAPPRPPAARSIVVVDRADLILAYGEAARSQGTTFDVLIDLDVGLSAPGSPSRRRRLRWRVA